MENPNDYDDDAYTEASTKLINNVASMIDECWDAGADPQNVKDDIAAGVTNSTAFRDHQVTVTISA